MADMPRHEEGQNLRPKAELVTEAPLKGITVDAEPCRKEKEEGEGEDVLAGTVDPEGLLTDEAMVIKFEMAGLQFIAPALAWDTEEGRAIVGLCKVSLQMVLRPHVLGQSC